MVQWIILLVSLANFLLGLLVIKKAPPSSLKHPFVIFIFLTGLWVFSNFLFQVNPTDFWFRTAYALGALIPSSALVWVLSFSTEKKPSPLLFYIGYGAGFLFFTLCYIKNFFLKGILIQPIGFREMYGVFFPLYSVYMSGILLFLLYKLFLSCKSFRGIKREQAKYIFLGGGIFAVVSVVVSFLLPVAGYAKLAILDSPSSLFFVGFTVSAIIQYRLMDITFVIRDTTLRLVSSLIPAAIFLTIGIVFFSLPIMIVMIVLTAIASPFLYGPLRRLLRSVILGGKYDYQKLLRESTKSLVSMLDLRQLLNYMVNTISETVGVEKISLFLREESKRRYEIKASYGLDEELVDSYVLKPNEGIIPWLKQSKAVFIKEEMERALPGKAFENIYGGLEKIGAEFILPLFYKDNLVGVLTLSNKQSGGIYNQTDIDILESLGAEAAVAIENARLHTEVITDELTDLYQPRYFELRLREEIEKSKRYRHCLSLMMVEVDNFEEKRYGEEKRDKLLKSMAGIIKGNLRMGDIACRCGEKGFGIILPEITEEPWGNIRERLKKQIRETVEIGERLRRRVKEEELGVTVSIGISSFDGQDREMKRETLIKQAKEALSQAKREGNTVKVFYDEKLRKEISSEVLEWIKETEETLVSGDICVDLTKHTVQVKGKPVNLTPKAFDLLCLLMKKKGRVLNRSFLTESIWGYEYFGTTRTVDSHIKSLRQKLGPEAKKVETIKGVGYKFVDEGD